MCFRSIFMSPRNKFFLASVTEQQPKGQGLRWWLPWPSPGWGTESQWRVWAVHPAPMSCGAKTWAPGTGAALGPRHQPGCRCRNTKPNIFGFLDTSPLDLSPLVHPHWGKEVSFPFQPPKPGVCPGGVTSRSFWDASLGCRLSNPPLFSSHGKS